MHSDKTVLAMKRFQFRSPTSISIFGPPYSGKSTLTGNILINSYNLFTEEPKLIVYCYKEDLSDFFASIERELKCPLIPHKGIPTKEKMDEWADGDHFLLILDDLQQACERDKSVADMFTVGSHHRNFSLIYLCHNIFGRGTFSRLINLNSHYIILFRNNRDRQQVVTLGRQIFGKDLYPYFIDAYNKATSQPHGYLVIDIHPKTVDSRSTLYSRITPGDDTLVYMPRDS